MAARWRGTFHLMFSRSYAHVRCRTAYGKPENRSSTSYPTTEVNYQCGAIKFIYPMLLTYIMLLTINERIDAEGPTVAVKTTVIVQ
jgi:hypothetical protein